MNRNNDRRKTLPVVKLEKDLDEDKIPKRVLPILGAPHASASFQVDVEEKKDMPTAIPSWLKLASDDNNTAYNAGGRVRHSVGLDVPGAVHTIRTPSKV